MKIQMDEDSYLWFYRRFVQDICHLFRTKIYWNIICYHNWKISEKTVIFLIICYFFIKTLKMFGVNFHFRIIKKWICLINYKKTWMGCWCFRFESHIRWWFVRSMIDVLYSFKGKKMFDNLDEIDFFSECEKLFDIDLWKKIRFISLIKILIIGT